MTTTTTTISAGALRSVAKFTTEQGVGDKQIVKLTFDEESVELEVGEAVTSESCKTEEAEH